MSTKEALLDVAEREVKEKGFAGFSFADLAQAVGIRKASIHHHFPTKQDLALQLIQRDRDRNTDRLADIEVSGKSGAAMVAVYIENVAGDTAGPTLELQIALGAFPDGLSGLVREVIAALHQDNLVWLEWAIDEGVRDGSLNPDLKPKQAARMLAVTIMGAQLSARATDKSKVFQKTATACLRQWRTGP